MFVLTIDQVGSRRGQDLVGAELADAAGWRARGAVLGPDRTAGDEFQLVHAEAGAALRAALDLTREDRWTVGMGIGAVDLPLPSTTREATGPAFAAAREAVDAAKRAAHRLVVVAPGDAVGAADATALLHLLLELRGRRSPEGWAVADLVGAGLTQAAAAERLGVTPQAVSGRARAAGVREERAAVPALTRVLARLNGVGAAP